MEKEIWGRELIDCIKLIVSVDLGVKYNNRILSN